MITGIRQRLELGTSTEELKVLRDKILKEIMSKKRRKK